MSCVSLLFARLLVLSFIRIWLFCLLLLVCLSVCSFACLLVCLFARLLVRLVYQAKDDQADAVKKRIRQWESENRVLGHHARSDVHRPRALLVLSGECARCVFALGVGVACEHCLLP